MYYVFYLTLKIISEHFFQDVVDVRLAVDDEGRFKGFGHVEFATPEAAQTVSLAFSTFVDVLLLKVVFLFGSLFCMMFI